LAVRAMSILFGGSITVDKSIITYRQGLGTKIKLPVTSVLLSTDDGYILYDTGFHPKTLTDPENTLGSNAKAVSLKEEDIIINRLESLNVKVEDIKYVINSHLHYDHTGGNYLFKNARFFVQRAEYQYAFGPDPFLSSAYIPSFFAESNYDLIDGSTELFPGVFVFTSPGHTPGHQSLIFELPKSGYKVLVGDAAYCDENINKQIPASNCYNPVIAVDSLLKLSTITKMAQGEMIICHDPMLFEQIKPSPYWYE